MAQSGDRKEKREFHPRSHAAIYVVGIIYLVYQLVNLLRAYQAGGPDSPSGLLLAGGILVLGGGSVLLGVLAWRMSQMSPHEAESPNEQVERRGEDTPGNKEE